MKKGKGKQRKFAQPKIKAYMKGKKIKPEHD